MKTKLLHSAATIFACLSLLATLPLAAGQAAAQNQTAVDNEQAEEAAPEPLGAEELEILVARIALYPDDLVAVITVSSLYPLQIVEAARFLERSKKDPNLEPKDDWDGSVISLLNYPEIINMMNDDIEWTQSLGDAMTYQEADILATIQQLRQNAVAKGVIKSDDRMKIVEEEDNIVIEPASQESLYLPRYEPEMLYEPNYPSMVVSYYPQPYPLYYYPTAPFFAAAVTGVMWGATVDWHDRGVWGGRWHHRGDVYINCRHCFNDRDFNGKVKLKDVDWRKVDRRKIKFEKGQLEKFDRRELKKSVKSDERNNINQRAKEVKKTRKDSKLNNDRKQKIKQQDTGQTGKKKEKAPKQEIKKRDAGQTGKKKDKARKQEIKKRDAGQTGKKKNKASKQERGQKSIDKGGNKKKQKKKNKQ